MIIAIDGYEANVKNRVGIGRYAFEILRNIYEIQKRTMANEYKTENNKQETINNSRHLKDFRLSTFDSNSSCTFRIYLPEAPLPDMPPQTAWWQYRVVPMKRLWTIVGLPLALTVDQPHADVIFSPTHYSPRFVATAKVMSVMDLSYLRFPELFRSSDLTQLTSWTKDSVRRARMILTISQSSKNDIIRAYHVQDEQVVVTYPGLSDAVFMKATKTKGNSAALPDSYILSVGTLQPRKNYEKLIEAYSIFVNRMKTGKTPKLVIVGKKGWLYEGILAAPRKYGVEDDVKFMEFVSDEDLPDIYKNAACFVLPSLYEGFGLPVLEAMSLGIPVVVSNVSSLPEIAGDAGIYVDPGDVESIVGGLNQAMREKGTKEEAERVKKGLSRVKTFSWERAAKQTLEVLKKVAHESRKGSTI